MEKALKKICIFVENLRMRNALIDKIYDFSNLNPRIKEQFSMELEVTIDDLLLKTFFCLNMDLWYIFVLKSLYIHIDLMVYNMKSKQERIPTTK